MADSCIISFSSQGRENYNKAMLGLVRSIKEHWTGGNILYSFDGYVDEYLGIKIRNCNSIQFPQPKAWTAAPHSEAPYQFKPAIFQIAIEEGYQQIIWCDSTIRLRKNPLPLLEQSESGIVCFENLGHPLWHWISDQAKDELGITNEELKTIPQIMACVIMFDFTKTKAKEVFEEYVIKARDGKSFQDSGSNRLGFTAHRHDQAVLSGLLWKHKIPLLPYGKLVYPPHDTDGAFGTDIYFVNKGIE